MPKAKPSGPGPAPPSTPSAIGRSKPAAPEQLALINFGPDVASDCEASVCIPCSPPNFSNSEADRSIQCAIQITYGPFLSTPPAGHVRERDYRCDRAT